MTFELDEKLDLHETKKIPVRDWIKISGQNEMRGSCWKSGSVWISIMTPVRIHGKIKSWVKMWGWVVGNTGYTGFTSYISYINYIGYTGYTGWTKWKLGSKWILEAPSGPERGFGVEWKLQVDGDIFTSVGLHYLTCWQKGGRGHCGVVGPATALSPSGPSRAIINTPLLSKNKINQTI